jgi:hypothetical protein
MHAFFSFPPSLNACSLSGTNLSLSYISMRIGIPIFYLHLGKSNSARYVKMHFKMSKN